jgi:rRNA maturation protein Nop10
MVNYTGADSCPKCGSKELGRGKQSGHALMSSIDKISFGSPIEYVICTDCGYIIEGYVTKPEKFTVKFKD